MNWRTNGSNLRAPFISPWMLAVCFRKALSRQISRYAKLIWSTVPSGWLWASEFQDREAFRLTYILKPYSALNTFIQLLHHFTDVFHTYATINMFDWGATRGDLLLNVKTIIPSHTNRMKMPLIWLRHSCHLLQKAEPGTLHVDKQAQNFG